MNQHQTDVNVFINDLDGGVFVNKLGAVLSEVAFGVNSTNKKGKVCVEFELSSLDENRVSVSHNVTNGAIVIHTQRLKSDPGGNLLS